MGNLQQDKKQVDAWRVSLLAAIGLHVLLLGIPFSPRSQLQSKESREEAIPVRTVKLSDLLASHGSLPAPNSPLMAGQPPEPPARSESPAKLIPAPEVSAMTDPEQSPAPEVSAMTDPEQSPAPKTPAAPPSEATPIPTPAPEVSPTPSPSQSPPAETANAQSFLERVATQSGRSLGTPTPALFNAPELFFDHPENSPALKPDILKTAWIDGQTPSQVYISVLQVPSDDFQIRQKNDYGGGTVYQISQGNAVWYINLVPTRDERGTIVVVWKHEPLAIS